MIGDFNEVFKKYEANINLEVVQCYKIIIRNEDEYEDTKFI